MSLQIDLLRQPCGAAATEVGAIATAATRPAVTRANSFMGFLSWDTPGKPPGRGLARPFKPANALLARIARGGKKFDEPMVYQRLLRHIRTRWWWRHSIRQTRRT